MPPVKGWPPDYQLLGGAATAASRIPVRAVGVALARKAKAAGAPLQLRRRIDLVTVRRHGARVRIKTGVKRDGTIMARERRFIWTPAVTTTTDRRDGPLGDAVSRSVTGF